MALSKTVLTPPPIHFVMEESADSFKGCAAILEVGITLKSSLKQHKLTGIDVNIGPGSEVSRRRSVQWTDRLGKDLVAYKEFEPSDAGDMDDEDINALQNCTCVIQ